MFIYLISYTHYFQTIFKSFLKKKNKNMIFSREMELVYKGRLSLSSTHLSFSLYFTLASALRN